MASLTQTVLRLSCGASSESDHPRAYRESVGCSFSLSCLSRSYRIGDNSDVFFEFSSRGDCTGSYEPLHLHSMMRSEPTLSHSKV